MKTRLGKRLTSLFNAIPTGYDCVWDLCCDHGRLGMAVIETKRAPRVHFVDCIESIMVDLESRLVRYGATGYELHTTAAENLRIPTDGKHLLVLAGVGDELSQRIIDAIISHQENAKVDWLISPSNNLFQVRRHLRLNNFGLQEEGVVFENGRAYEWLRVTQNRTRAPIEVPNPASFWDADNPSHRAHLQKLIRHARKQLNSPNQADAEQALALYEAVFSSE